MDDMLNVLFLAANPVDVKYKLRLDEEFREINSKVRAGRYRDSIKLSCEWAVRSSDLTEALLVHKPHVVHFSGHGSESDGIILEDRSGNAKPVNKQALARLFQVLRDNIRVVVLNACYAEDQAKWLREIVDYTIGMNDQVVDRNAIVFSAAFYQALAYARTVKEAFELALIELDLESLGGSDIPRLLVRDGVDQAAPIFDLAAKREPEQSAEPGKGSTGGVNIGRIKSKVNVIGEGNTFNINE